MEYFIDQQLVDDIECRHKNKNKSYTKYCISCKKNLCPWCKGHENHSTIYLDSIEPDEEKYESWKIKMEEMQSIDDEMKKKYLDVLQIKEEINSLNDFINEIFEKLKKYNNEFKEHLKYNSLFFNCYIDNKRNYYILNNFNNLNFDLTSEIEFLNNLNNNSKFEKIINISNILRNKNFVYNNKLEICKENEFQNLCNKTITTIEIEKQVNLSLLKNENSEFKNSLKSLNYGSKNFILDGKEARDNNMWISEKYCKNWGLREAIREFIQNQYDGIITKINSKKNLYVKKIEGEKKKKKRKNTFNNERKKYLDFDFLNKEKNKIFGQIRYDDENKILTISNVGELFLADFLLGGSKDEQNNSEIIGTFGEGMKLAILALCRLEKDVIIISSNKKYSFRLKEDNNFIKNSIPQKCLHCKIEEYCEHDSKEQIKVIIHNITRQEWANEVDNFLWLLERDIEIYTSFDEKNNVLGQIIYEDYLKSKIFVKGIFVQRIKEDEENVVPGFNTFSLKLDRDRNCIQDTWELKNIISKIISGTFNKNIDYLKSVQKKTGETFKKTEYGFEKTDKKDEANIGSSCKSQIKNLTKNLIYCLENKNIDIFSQYWLKDYLSKESIEIIWNEMNLKPENKNKQPTDNIGSIKQFIEDKKLPENFYPFYSVHYNLLGILKESSSYKTIETKFKEYAEKAKNVEPRKEYKIAIKDVCSKIQFISKDFNESKIKFKNFGKIDENLCFKNNDEIYFSSIKLEEKLSEEWKFWFFVKILNIIGTKIEDSFHIFYSLFDKLLTK